MLQIAGGIIIAFLFIFGLIAWYAQDQRIDDGSGGQNFFIWLIPIIIGVLIGIYVF